MSKPVLGLIGAIGAGKSAAAAAFAKQGGHVVDADRIGHAVLEEPIIKEKLAERWGPDIALLTGRDLRRKIAAIVFADAAERKALESLMYPAIETRCREAIIAAQANPAVRFVVLDAAVMLEAGWNGIVDKLVYVDAPLEIRRQRIASRGWSADDLAAREAAQWSSVRKRAKADTVIQNNGTLADLDRTVEDLLAQWGWTRWPA